MTQHYIPFQNSNISYCRFGNSNHVIFALHGYSNDARIFEILEPDLKNDFTLIAIDLPIHGLTRWRSNFFTPKKLNEIISLIIKKEDLPDRYSLLGFSLGGRIALSLYQNFPSNVDELILLSPDGLYKTRWYKFVAQTTVGNRIMAFLLKRPQEANNILEWCKKNGLINAHLYIYAKGLLSSKRERTLLYTRWIYMRKMKPNLTKLCKTILKYCTPVKLVFGRADTITPEHNADFLVQYAAPYVSLQEWEAGHLLLREKYRAQLVALFN